MSDDRITGYAAGILEIARAEGQLERVEAELFQIGQAVVSSPELYDALADPRVPGDRKQAIVTDLIGGRASDLTVSIASFVVTAGRGQELGAIAEALASGAAASRNKEVATVRSAIALDDETVARLAAALGKATGKEVDVKVVVDPNVVGGIVATVGDTVIDGSVRSKLDSLRAALAR
ncbi:MAG: ATP synthase F1 subunit delta [Acidimicrobiia bacterium]|nr:MAG: ATP synthase F1 subunit delta [Acidimicrobiia bacterium]